MTVNQRVVKSSVHGRLKNMRLESVRLVLPLDVLSAVYTRYF